MEKERGMWSDKRLWFLVLSGVDRLVRCSCIVVDILCFFPSSRPGGGIHDPSAAMHGRQDKQRHVYLSEAAGGRRVGGGLDRACMRRDWRRGRTEMRGRGCGLSVRVRE